MKNKNINTEKIKGLATGIALATWPMISNGAVLVSIPPLTPPAGYVSGSGLPAEYRSHFNSCLGNDDPTSTEWTTDWTQNDTACAIPADVRYVDFKEDGSMVLLRGALNPPQTIAKAGRAVFKDLIGKFAHPTFQYVDANGNTQVKGDEAEANYLKFRRPLLDDLLSQKNYPFNDTQTTQLGLFFEGLGANRIACMFLNKAYDTDLHCNGDDTFARQEEIFTCKTIDVIDRPIHVYHDGNYVGEYENGDKLSKGSICKDGVPNQYTFR